MTAVEGFLDILILEGNIQAGRFCPRDNPEFLGQKKNCPRDNNVPYFT